MYALLVKAAVMDMNAPSLTDVTITSKGSVNLPVVRSIALNCTTPANDVL